jgi:hypothetical protein
MHSQPIGSHRCCRGLRSRSNQVCLLALAILVACSSGEERSTSNVSAVELANRTVELLIERDLDAVTRLYHYPESFSSNELREDQRGIARSLEILSNEFGDIRSATIVKDPTVVYLAGAFSASPEYWGSKPDGGIDRDIAFNVEFSTEPRGIVDIKLFNDGQWKLQTVSFGVEADVSNGLERVTEVTVSMAEEISETNNEGLIREVMKALEPPKDDTI